jgi:orotidine-5'-phosphate decarboxylase
MIETIHAPNPIALALDFDDPARVREIAALTSAHVGVFKVGLTAYASGGPPLVRDLAANHPVFLDLKFHDIPAQVAGAVRGVAATGALYTTVHASGGSAMVAAAVEAAGHSLTVLAVTVLTSLDDWALEAIGLKGPAADATVRLAGLALAAGADGLVCSAHEVDELRREFGARRTGGPLLVVPGIRGPGESHGDQRRTMSAADALDAGADLIVVGRPITSAPDPAEAARRLCEQVRR